MSGPVGGRIGRRATVRGLQYLGLVLYMVFLSFPLLWMLSTALKSPRQLATVGSSLIPSHPDWSNFATALGEQGLLRSAANSVQVALGSTLLVMVVALPAAYALARLRDRLRTIALGWILVSQVFPVILVVVPLFLILRGMGLFDTHIGLVLVYLVWSLPFALWMLQGYVAAIPAELEEAAAVDGAGRLRVLTRIVLPLLAPGLVATALFSFVSAWNEFFFALVLIQSPDLATLPLTLARFVGSEGQVQLGPLAAGSLLATIPSLAFFLVLQRRLTSGLLAGSVKG
jgi:multiple sugar transport system permease protein